MKRLIVSLGFGLVALAVNPMLACQNDDEQEPAYHFGEAEMRKAIEGTYTGTVSSSGKSVSVTLEQTGSSSPRTTQSYKRVQCGTRSFVKPAAACIDATEMAVVAHVTSEDPAIQQGDLTGAFTVYGTELTDGEVYVSGPNDVHLSTSEPPGSSRSQWVYQTEGSRLVLNLVKESAK